MQNIIFLVVFRGFSCVRDACVQDIIFLVVFRGFSCVRGVCVQDIIFLRVFRGFFMRAWCLRVRYHFGGSI